MEHFEYRAELGEVWPDASGARTALARGRRLGVIKPDAGQTNPEKERYRNLGLGACGLRMMGG